MFETGLKKSSASPDLSAHMLNDLGKAPGQGRVDSLVDKLLACDGNDPAALAEACKILGNIEAVCTNREPPAITRKNKEILQVTNAVKVAEISISAAIAGLHVDPAGNFVLSAERAGTANEVSINLRRLIDPSLPPIKLATVEVERSAEVRFAQSRHGGVLSIYTPTSARDFNLVKDSTGNVVSLSEIHSQNLGRERLLDSILNHDGSRLARITSENDKSFKLTLAHTIAQSGTVHTHNSSHKIDSMIFDRDGKSLIFSSSQLLESVTKTSGLFSSLFGSREAKVTCPHQILCRMDLDTGSVSQLAAQKESPPFKILTQEPNGSVIVFSGKRLLRYDTSAPDKGMREITKFSDRELVPDLCSGSEGGLALVERRYTYRSQGYGGRVWDKGWHAVHYYQAEENGKYRHATTFTDPGLADTSDRRLTSLSADGRMLAVQVRHDKEQIVGVYAV